VLAKISRKWRKFRSKFRKRRNHVTVRALPDAMPLPILRVPPISGVPPPYETVIATNEEHVQRVRAVEEDGDSPDIFEQSGALAGLKCKSRDITHAEIAPAETISETVAETAPAPTIVVSEAGSLSPAPSKEEAPSLPHEDLMSPQTNPRDTSSTGQLRLW
jgi:hypothetical protein